MDLHSLIFHLVLQLGTAGNLEGDGYHLGGVFVLGPGEQVGVACFKFIVSNLSTGDCL